MEKEPRESVIFQLWPAIGFVLCTPFVIVFLTMRCCLILLAWVFPVREEVDGVINWPSQEDDGD